MEVTHHTRNLTIAPRKLRLVADSMRYKTATQAVAMLPLMPQKGAGILLKSLKSAIQVAKDNDIDAETLVIHAVWCNEGSALKRSISRSRGRMTMIMKRHSHLSIVLTGEPAKRVSKKAASKPTQTEEVEA